MLASLFRRLTAKPHGGVALFDAVTAEARQPHWYVEGAVPDTIDGRFAVLGTLTALTMVRLELAGDEGRVPAVALTERFIYTSWRPSTGRSALVIRRLDEAGA